MKAFVFVVNNNKKLQQIHKGGKGGVKFRIQIIYGACLNVWSLYEKKI